jgi:hypothetical protein
MSRETSLVGFEASTGEMTSEKEISDCGWFFVKVISCEPLGRHDQRDGSHHVLEALYMPINVRWAVHGCLPDYFGRKAD